MFVVKTPVINYCLHNLSREYEYLFITPVCPPTFIIKELTYLLLSTVIASSATLTFILEYGLILWRFLAN